MSDFKRGYEKALADLRDFALRKVAETGDRYWIDFAKSFFRSMGDHVNDVARQPDSTGVGWSPEEFSDLLDRMFPEGVMELRPDDTEE